MPQADPFASQMRGLTSPATQHFPIIPADGVDLPTRPRVLRIIRKRLPLSRLIGGAIQVGAVNTGGFSLARKLSLCGAQTGLSLS